jgi:D-xylono/L-arabinono-1,4-lactonase
MPADVTPELVADTRCALGEGPLWHPAERRVYWSDITAGHLYRYSPETGQHERCFSGAQVGGFTVQADGSLLLFMERGAIARWDPASGELKTLVEEIPEVRDSRFNDVAADPAGRVFCGTMGMPNRTGRLYRLDADGSLHIVLGGVGISNGIGFTPDHRRMYYTDTALSRIDVFDYDEATGALSSRRTFAEVPEGDGLPDGLTVDAEGGVWSARWDGRCLVRYTPDGREERRISFPARKVSSAAFGGPDAADLYVTTAGGDDRATEGQGAGALFRLRPGVRGLPDFPSRVRL